MLELTASCPPTALRTDPDALVPWTQLFYKDDAVTLSQHRQRAIHRTQTPRATPTKRKDPRPSTPQFEAGPWTR